MARSANFFNKRRGKNSPVRYMVNAGIAFLSLALGGCIDLYEPTSINSSRVQVKEESFIQDVRIEDVNDEYLKALALHYAKHGGSPMDLLITYDPHSSGYTAMKAANKVAEVAGVLRDEYGVSEIESGIMPVSSQGEDVRLLISYDSYSASAPSGCENMMPGMERPMDTDEEYKLGCSLDTLLARQIARPKDLLGKGAVDYKTDGRPAANIVDTYRTGAENAPLEGESASGE